MVAEAPNAALRLCFAECRHSARPWQQLVAEAYHFGRYYITLLGSVVAVVLIGAKQMYVYNHITRGVMEVSRAAHASVQVGLARSWCRCVCVCACAAGRGFVA